MKMKLLLIVWLLLAPLFAVLTPGGHASAFTMNSNRIIDDAVFSNSHTMSANDINNFLNSFPGSCISPNSGFSAVDPIGYNPSQGYLYGGNVSAGQIIYDAANAYEMNPQVILATLQKEEGLIKGDGPYGCSTLAISAAVGYGCPDSSNLYNWSGVSLYTRSGTTYTSINGICVNGAQKVGFSQQIIHAAWLFKFGQQRSLGHVNWAIVKGNWDNSDDLQSCYGLRMTEGYYQTCPNGPTSYYDGLYGIDGQTVHMDTGATAAFYNYTPHFHGNQVFDDLFTGWFGSVYSNDSLVAHPNGTIVSDGQRVFVIENNTKRHILNPSIFESYGYSWSEVKRATTGDNTLTEGTPVSTLAPGTVFTTNTGQVFVVDSFSGVTKKQWLSYSSFQALGYSWSEVLNVPAGYDTTPVASGVYTSTKHPAGTLVLASNGGTYVMGETAKQHIVSPTAFQSYNFNWSRVHQATSADNTLGAGTSLDIRQGAILYSSGNIYLVDSDAQGLLKRPFGPWECYNNRFSFTSADWINVGAAALPTRTGSLFTC
jgi:hypothetical protein